MRVYIVGLFIQQYGWVMKYKKAGGKIVGKHTTFIPSAKEVLSVLEKCGLVQGINLGYIKTGTSSAGIPSVKITMDGSSLLLSVRGGNSQQEIRVLSSNLAQAEKDIIAGLKNAGVVIKEPKKA
jgi:hypothetical protein